MTITRPFSLPSAASNRLGRILDMILNAMPRYEPNIVVRRKPFRIRTPAYQESVPIFPGNSAGIKANCCHFAKERSIVEFQLRDRRSGSRAHFCGPPVCCTGLGYVRVLFWRAANDLELNLLSDWPDWQENRARIFATLALDVPQPTNDDRAALEAQIDWLQRQREQRALEASEERRRIEALLAEVVAHGPLKSAYQVLGLGPGSSLDDAKRALRQHAKKHHPDRGGDANVFKRYLAAFEEILARFQVHGEL